jgi:predicted MarR family transcription regulator
MASRRTSARKAAATSNIGDAPVVPGHLLASPEGAALVRLEFASMRIAQSFATWVRFAHRHSDGPPLSFHDIFLLHCLRFCGSPQTITELRLFTDPYALPRLQSGVRTLLRARLVSPVRRAGEREPRYALTTSGMAVTDRYAALRERALVRLFQREVGIVSAMTESAALLERAAGLYRQAARSIGDETFLPPRRLPAVAAPTRPIGKKARRAG